MIRIRNSVGCLALVASLALTGLGLGCGGGSSAAPLTEDDFCQQKAEKECQVTVRCGSTVSLCVPQRKTMCLAVVAASKTAPRVFHPENVSACVSKTNSVYAQTTIKPSDLDAMDDICAYVFQGNSSTVCAVKYDCKDKTQICDKGLCVKSSPQSMGAFCVSPGQTCATGSYCANSPTTNQLTCLPKAAQSAACSDAIPCIESLRCDATTQVCMLLVTAGDACVSNGDCVTTAPYCDPAIGGKCDSGLAFSGGAPACGLFGGSVATGTGGSGGGTGGASGAGGTSDAGQ